MRKIFLLLIVCVPFLGLRAQEDYTDEVDYEATTETAASPIQDKLDKVAAKLQLTEDQVPEVEALLLAYFQELKDNPPASPQEKGARRRALRAAVGQLLTPEQRQRMRKGKAQGGNRKQAEKRKAAPPARSNDNWLDRLIDDIAMPILEQRQSNRRGQGGG